MNSDLSHKIHDLKKQKEALILAHNYQLPEVQDIADFVGDSLELSIKASKTDAKVIIFCGVSFMAETANILAPDKIVILPDQNAGCPMANMITADNLREYKQKNPEAVVVCYINTTAEVKAESDICVTSGCAMEVINSIDDSKEILFVPDQHLGGWLQKEFPDKKFILYPGFCNIHVRILPEDIERLKKQHPNAEVLIHPETPERTLRLADYVLGTGGMLKHVKKSPAKEFIIGTESGMIHKLKKENPDKIFYPIGDKAICPNMKLTTLEKILWALEDVNNPQAPAKKIIVPENVRIKAKVCIDRMMEIARK